MESSYQPSGRWLIRFGPLFLDFVRMMVSSGLAGAHVQPCPRNKIPFCHSERSEESRLVPVQAETQIPRFTRDDKIGSCSGLRDVFEKAGPVAQVARAHP
jgi:hypothetical protein